MRKVLRARTERLDKGRAAASATLKPRKGDKQQSCGAGEVTALAALQHCTGRLQRAGWMARSSRVDKEQGAAELPQENEFCVAHQHLPISSHTARGSTTGESVQG